MNDDQVQRVRTWIAKRGEDARLGELGRQVFGVDFDDHASVRCFRKVVDELERRSVIRLRQSGQGGVYVIGGEERGERHHDPGRRSGPGPRASR